MAFVSDTDLSATGSGQGANMVGFKQPHTGAVSRTAMTKMRDTVSVKDFGATGDGVTDDTAAIQAALNSGAANVYVPEGTYLFSTLTVLHNTRLSGASTRKSILKHTGSSVAISCYDTSLTEPDGRGSYIDSGWFIFEDFELMANGTIGFAMGNNRTSFSRFERIYIRHRRDLEADDPDNEYFPESIAIDCSQNENNATYIEKVHHCLIRGFETGIHLKTGVNGWEIARVHMIECKNQVSISGATGIGIDDCYFETQVESARGIVFGNEGGNSISVNNTAFELTNLSGTQYAYDFSAGGDWTEILCSNIKYLLVNDGNGVNNRRISGTSPTGFLEIGRSYISGNYGLIPMMWAPGTSPSKPFQSPTYSRFGGFQQGNGRILIGRNDTDAADAVIENTATHLVISYANGVQFKDAGGATGWQNPIWLGAYALWVDSAGKLRILNGQPTANTDGVIVGTQS